MATCSAVRKNNENNNNNNNNNLKMVLVLCSHTFSSKISKFFKEIGLRRVLTTLSYMSLVCPKAPKLLLTPSHCTVSLVLR